MRCPRHIIIFVHQLQYCRTLMWLATEILQCKILVHGTRKESVMIIYDDVGVLVFHISLRSICFVTRYVLDNLEISVSLI